jgi:hypothetical protein
MLLKFSIITFLIIKKSLKDHIYYVDFNHNKLTSDVLLTQCWRVQDKTEQPIWEKPGINQSSFDSRQQAIIFKGQSSRNQSSVITGHKHSRSTITALEAYGRKCF